jgi:hypothetical protein
MVRLPRIIVIHLMLAYLLLFSVDSIAQESAKEKKEKEEEAAIKAMVDARQFVYEAQSATPMRGTTRTLTSIYTLTLNRDTLLSDLPYFGRAYIVSGYGSTDGGISFKTADFDYAVEDVKKGGWNITLTPKKIKDVSRMTLFVSEAGYGSLQVTSNTRELISFYGYIHPIKK